MVIRMEEFKYDQEFILDDDNPEFVTLSDEDGLEDEFVVVACIKVDDQFYAMLLPTEVADEDEDDVAYVFAVRHDGIDPYFEYVDDEDVISAVFERYDALYEASMQTI